MARKLLVIFNSSFQNFDADKKIAVIKYKNCFLQVDTSLLPPSFLVSKGTMVQVIGECDENKICKARVWTQIENEEPEFNAELFEKCVIARRAYLAKTEKK